MPHYAITTFGCQMNVHDSERMHETLRRSGYSECASPRDADVVVLNTCSVRDKAEQKLYSEVGRLAKLKRDRPELVVVVAGCVAQQEGERLLESMRSIDLVIGPDNIPELPRLLDELALGSPPLVRTVFDVDSPQFLTATSVAGSAPTAFVTVMKGCDERCSFCIVPYTRGPERYRPSHEIVAEIATLCAAGVREVTLLGQTVNSYRDPARSLPASADAEDPDESEFAALLRAIARQVPELARLRYTSPHPRHLTRSLIEAHADLPMLARHVHMPVQSGSDRMLKRMIRRYTREEYVARTKALVERNPGLTLSTDIIVGFPGETADDFEQTLSLVREVDFKGLFGFKYSPRPYTPALRLADDVSEFDKSERLTRLFELSEELLARHLHSLVGSRAQVLVEGPSKAKRGEAPTSLCGRTHRNEIVHIKDAADLELVGALVDVVVTRAYRHSLEANLSETTRADAPRLAAPPSAVTPREQVPVAGGRRSLPLVGREVV